MAKRRTLNIEKPIDIQIKYHLPILNRPESAAEIASVICGVASNIKADLLAIVSPLK